MENAIQNSKTMFENINCVKSTGNLGTIKPKLGLAYQAADPVQM